MSKFKELIHELKHHAPFTAIATLMAVVVILFIQFVLIKNVSETAFEILHPAHVIFSGIVTAAIFYKYKKNAFQAIAVGMMGAILIGTLSDVIIPFLGGKLLALDIKLHLPIFEEPFIILGSALFGSVIGISTKITKMPHFMHVFLSVFASLFYLMAFSAGFSLVYFIAAFFIVFISVVFTACLSDIIFPFFFLGKRIKTCNC